MSQREIDKLVRNDARRDKTDWASIAAISAVPALIAVVMLAILLKEWLQ